jgi:hypothetical protein
MILVRLEDTIDLLDPVGRVHKEVINFPLIVSDKQPRAGMDYQKAALNQVSRLVYTFRYESDHSRRPAFSII